MLPMDLLQACIGQVILIELRNGDTYNGSLDGIDNFMNIKLNEVICTSKTGDRFWKMDMCYIRGPSVKVMRIPDEALDVAKQQQQEGGGSAHRGGFSNRGNSRGGRGGNRGGRGGNSNRPNTQSSQGGSSEQPRGGANRGHSDRGGNRGGSRGGNRGGRGGNGGRGGSNQGGDNRQKQQSE